jgi:hypothetical protein
MVSTFQLGAHSVRVAPDHGAEFAQLTHFTNVSGKCQSSCWLAFSKFLLLENIQLRNDSSLNTTHLWVPCLRENCIKDEFLCLREIHSVTIYDKFYSREVYGLYMGLVLFMSQSSRRLCKLIYLKFLRCMLRRHDYRMLRYNIYNLDIYRELRFSNITSSCINNDLGCAGTFTTSYVRGGIVDRFTINEVQDCLIQDYGSVPTPVGMIYQFNNYSLKSKLDSDLSTSENIIKCNIH